MRPLVLAALLGALVPPAREPVIVIRAGSLHLADGSTLPDAVLVVEGGRVAAVGSGLPAPVPSDAEVLRAPVACAGFADLATRVPGGNDGEDPRPFAPGLRAADGLDPRDPAAASDAAEGVLARLLLPSDRNPAGGRAAVLRAADPRGRLEVVAADAGGVFSLAGAAARRERYPGSLLGIVRGLESAFRGDDPLLLIGPADREALASLAKGAAPALLYARTGPEVAAALRLAAARGLRPVLVDPRCGAPAILEAAAAAGLRPSALGAILELDVDDPLFHLRAPGLLSKAGVAVGFGGGGVRRSAALAARHGMEPAAARGALLGKAHPGAGRPLSVGSPADLVLLDGDPIEPASRVIRVLVGGAATLRRTRP